MPGAPTTARQQPLLLVLLCISAAAPSPAPDASHIKIFSFYSHGNNLTAQEGIVNVRLGHDAGSPSQAGQLAPGWWTRRADGSLATNFSDVVKG